jgi:release factor glutamine methyltransferase
LPFRLSPETLVPRPDTETVVEAALASAADRNGALRILDLGTGSGCILVALLSELPNAFGLGVDRSPGALATARHNARANGAGPRSGFAASDWGAALNGGFDLIVSNPPYIREPDIAALDPEVSHFDPILALHGGLDGLAAYRIILADSGRLLRRDGVVVLEVGYDQAEEVAALATASGFSRVQVRRDLSGHPRAVTLSRKSDGVVFGG